MVATTVRKNFSIEDGVAKEMDRFGRVKWSPIVNDALKFFIKSVKEDPKKMEQLGYKEV